MRITTRTICLSTKYKGGNYSILKLEDETTPNIKGEITFSIILFLVGKTMYFLL